MASKSNATMTTKDNGKTASRRDTGKTARRRDTVSRQDKSPYYLYITSSQSEKNIKRQAMFGKDPDKFKKLIEDNDIDVNALIGGKTLLRWVLWGAYNYSRYRENYIVMADYLINKGADYNLVNEGGITDLQHILATEEIKDDFLKVINNRTAKFVSSVMVTKRREMPSMKKWGDKNIMSNIYDFAKAEKKRTRKRKRKKKKGKRKIKKKGKKTAKKTAKKGNGKKKGRTK